MRPPATADTGVILSGAEGRERMQLSLETGDGTHRVRAYDPGRITVGDRVFTRSLILSPDRIIPDWPPERFEDLAAPAVEPLLALDPEIVLLGTGARQRFPHPQVLAAVHARGIGIEIMDTPAACRTFNILSAEGRRVVAALLMI